MWLSKLSTCWPTGVWEYLRPTSLVKHLVDCFRVVLDAGRGVESITEYPIPVGQGSNYKVISIPLSCIESNRNVSGVGHILDKDYPYIVTELPAGILSFRPSASAGNCACRFYDFVEVGGVYYFKAHPSTYGVVNIRESEDCTFVIQCGESWAAPKSPVPQALPAHSYSINKELLNIRGDIALCNGVGLRPHNLLGGVTLASCAGRIVRSWIEGTTGLCQLDNGELLRCGTTNSLSELKTPGTGLRSGESGRVSNTVVIYRYNGVDYPIICNEITDTVDITHCPGLCEVLELPDNAAEMPYHTVDALLKRKGEHTIQLPSIAVSTSVAGQLLDSLDRSSGIHTATVTDLTVGADVPILTQSPDLFGLDVKDIADAAYLYFSTNTHRPLTSPGAIPESAIFNNLPTYKVVRTPIHQVNGSYVALTTNGKLYGEPLEPGDKLRAVTLIKAGKRVHNDIILKMIEAHAEDCRPIGTAVLRLTIESDVVTPVEDFDE